MCFLFGFYESSFTGPLFNSFSLFWMTRIITRYEWFICLKKSYIGQNDVKHIFVSGSSTRSMYSTYYSVSSLQKSTEFGIPQMSPIKHFPSYKGNSCRVRNRSLVKLNKDEFLRAVRTIAGTPCFGITLFPGVSTLPQV
ncbi:hypothetical protein EG68_00407 [Paragonimus skrjabini miyazakii]|uniref:Uncharacterized protein n=1 Tax=Paragonimus skrjabini miyazakii TaxID=59628 RepID=A0A8S9ZAG5_9TREM|nr:hypothetical protein EG68_00407 [Paragonimus skrjabini miyazakii]